MPSLSSCSLISLGSHFPSSGDRWSSPSMHFQLEEQGRGFRRAKGWGDAPLCPSQWLARGEVSLSPQVGYISPWWPAAGLWVPLEGVSVLVKGVLQPPLHLCVGRALPWLCPAGRAEETTWMWQSGHHFCKVLRHLSELKHLTMCKEWTHYWRAPESWICLSKSVSSWVKVGEQPSFFFMFT